MKARLLVILFVLAFAVPTFGSTIDIDFGTGLAGVGGTFALLTGGNVNATNIPIGVMTIDGTASYDGAFAVTGACKGGSACLDFNTVTNTISINGAVPGWANLGSPVDLLSGSFSAFSLTAAGGGGFLFSGSGPDVKNSYLLEDIGLAGNLVSSFNGFNLTTSNKLPGTRNSYGVISTDIRNTITPEPVSMLLMGTFFSLAGGLLSKKKRAL